MILAKDIRNTVAYKQMRAWNDRENGGNPWSLGALVKKYLHNVNEQGPANWKPVDGVNIDRSFTWADTDEGYAFWSKINEVEVGEPRQAGRVHLPIAPAPAPMVFDGQEVFPVVMPAGLGIKAKKPAAKKEEVKKTLGWWQ